MQDQHLFPEIPSCTWNRPIGLGWDKPYTVRNPVTWMMAPGTENALGLRCRLHEPFLTRRLQPVHRWRRPLRASPPVNSASEQPADSPSPTPCVPSHPLMAPREPGSGIQQVRGALGRKRTSPTLNTGTYHALIRAAGLSTEGVFQTQLSEQFSPIWAENLKPATR